MEKLQLDIPLPSQGINYADDSLISDYEAAEGTVNICFKDGLPQTRKGYAIQSLYAHDGEADMITRLFFHNVASVKRLVFCYAAIDAVEVYQFNESKNPVRRTLGHSGSTKPNFLPISCALTGGYSYSEKVIMADGTAIKFFDETNGLTAISPYVPTSDEIADPYLGTNVLSTTPDEINKQKYILLDNGRIWLAGYKNLVRFCDKGTAGTRPDYWPSSHVFKLSEDCTGMVSFMGEVLLFTENSGTLISGASPVAGIGDNYANNALPGGYGCVSHDTIAVGDNAVYWANKNGIFRYRYTPSGFSIPECVSEFLLTDNHTRTIKKKLDTITDWTKVFAVFYDHEYRLFINDGDRTNEYSGSGGALVFDTIGSTWTYYQYGNFFGHAAVYQDQLYCGAKNQGSESKYWIYRMDYPFNPDDTAFNGLSDDGQSIYCVLKSKFFDFSKAANKKRFKRFYFTIYSELLSYDIDLIVNMDNEEQVMSSVIRNKVSRWGNSDPSDDEDEVAYAFAFGDVVSNLRTNLNYPVRLQHRGKKYNIQYELQSGGLNHSWMLKSVVLMLKIKELK